ncbi:hypothetical protein ACVNS2_10590 [Paenibacillus caseinilyticus]|uniref:Uncharacterized protein n=1 Tax=Paenibacillus mucilaginosus K02 TaxID=997761 RepID=I0BFE4_9BACL|nr:hypothetical protein [Paenibacillus mucilaginosus]AFH61091.1 hypothetical protein B2K_10205 [Paenibacillus mucilaginosus K02]
MNAQASLLLTLQIMTARLQPATNLQVPMATGRLFADGQLTNPQMQEQLEALMAALAAAAREPAAGSGAAD